MPCLILRRVIMAFQKRQVQEDLNIAICLLTNAMKMNFHGVKVILFYVFGIMGNILDLNDLTG